MLDLAPIIVALAATHGHTDVERLQDVASDVRTVAEQTPVFCGEASVDATALAMIAVGEHESGWHPGAQSGELCNRGAWCDRGASRGLWQVNVAGWDGWSKADIDGNVRLQATLSIRLLRRFRGRSSTAALFSAYASGGGKVSRVGRDIDAIFRTLARRNGIAVAFSGGCLRATNAIRS